MLPRLPAIAAPGASTWHLRDDAEPGTDARRRYACRLGVVVIMRQTRFVCWAEEAEARRFREFALYDDQIQIKVPQRYPRVNVVGLIVTLFRSRSSSAAFGSAALSRQLSTSREGARSNQVSCYDGILPPRRRFGSKGPQADREMRWR